MILKNTEVKKLNLKIRELAIQESKKQITEKECKEQTELLRARIYELTKKYIKDKSIVKKELEKKTVESTLWRAW